MEKVFQECILEAKAEGKKRAAFQSYPFKLKIILIRLV